jgi:hypothetical protein
MLKQKRISTGHCISSKHDFQPLTISPMKTVLFSLCLLLSASVYSQEFKKLDNANINKKQMEFAKKFADDYFAKQIAGSYYLLNDKEATDEMIKGLTADRQKEVYDQLKSGFGGFKSLEFAQTWFDANTHLVIYRFKGTFGVSNLLEIRVVLNYQGKIAGFFVKPWTEKLQ